MRKVTRAISFLLVLFFSHNLQAASLPNWAKKLEEIRLANGMKFLLYERGEAPIFSAWIRFRAGGIDEEEGKTGLAHFLEHMAFKGTSKIGTNDFLKEKPILDQIEKVGQELGQEYARGGQPSRIRSLRDRLRLLHQEEEKYLVKEEVSKRMLENGGIDYNATTSKDVTSYFVSLPSEKLRFWAEFESERIFRPIFREFYEEKDVVIEERRMRVDNDPEGRLSEALFHAAFEGSPYRWPTIGTEADLRRLTTRDLETFWRRHYRPSNAVGALVGKFSMKEARRILEETFGRVEFNALPMESKRAAGDTTIGGKERRVTVSFPARPRLMVAYHKPTLPDRDDYLFDLLEQILGEGRTSRLYKRLVLTRQVVSRVETSAGVPGARLPNLFLIELDPLGNHSPEEVLRLLDLELERVKKEGVTAGELSKAKKRLTVDLLWRLQTNSGLAAEISWFEAVTGSWRYLANYLQEIDRFRPEDIQDLAKRYLIPSKRTIAILKP